MGLTVSEVDRIKYLKSSMVFDAFLGNYKDFKAAKKEYASLAVKDFNKLQTIPSPKASAPIFSKYGLNMLSVMIREFFRKKTPEEKLLKQMGEEAKLKNKLNMQA